MTDSRSIGQITTPEGRSSIDPSADMTSNAGRRMEMSDRMTPEQSAIAHLHAEVVRLRAVIAEVDGWHTPHSTVDGPWCNWCDVPAPCRHMRVLHPEGSPA